MNEDPVLNEDPIIEVNSLAVRYGRTAVLEDISFQVGAGEVYALLGRNGAGKSSLMRCLLGHQKPRSGQIRMFGNDVWKHRLTLMERVGVVPETGDAPPSMTARQISRFCSRLYPRWHEDQLRERLGRFNVPLTVPFGKLSKGQRGQVMLSLALASEPELLVLDDPTLGLDVVARKAVFEELITELADRGITVLLTSHDLPGIEGIASRIGFLQDGQLRLDEDLEDLKTRFRQVTLGPIDLIAAPDLLAPLQSVGIESRGRDVVARVARFDKATFEALRRAPGIERAEASALSLEEILITVAEMGALPR